jgi:hypothetical protein
LIVFSLFHTGIKAQRLNIEPGITLGGSYYMGDVNHTKQMYSPSFTYGLAFRQSFNEYYALRLNILKAKVKGNDADFSNGYQLNRAHSFVNNIYELGLQIEFNFFEFNTFKKKSSAPYITVGAALAVSNSFSSFAFAVPMGIGYKYSVSKRLSLSAEWSFRTTSTDELDLLVQSDPLTKQITKLNNNDWYSILGLTLTYNFKNEKKWCPAYSKNKQNK